MDDVDAVDAARLEDGTRLGAVQDRGRIDIDGDLEFREIATAAENEEEDEKDAEAQNDNADHNDNDDADGETSS